MSQKKELKLPNQSSPGERINYSSLTKAEIQLILEQQGIEYKSGSTKAELITLLVGDVDG